MLLVSIVFGAIILWGFTYAIKRVSEMKVNGEEEEIAEQESEILDIERRIEVIKERI